VQLVLADTHTHTHTHTLSVSLLTCYKLLISLFLYLAVTDEEREVSGKEGKTIILNTDDEMQKNDQVWWLFGEENSLIAEIKGGTGDIITYGGTGGRFRDRLKLDKKTGSLTITNIRSTDAGLYQVWINRSSSRKNKHLRFTVSFRREYFKSFNVIMFTILPYKFSFFFFFFFFFQSTR